MTTSTVVVGVRRFSRNRDASLMAISWSIRDWNVPPSGTSSDGRPSMESGAGRLKIRRIVGATSTRLTMPERCVVAVRR